MAYAGLTQSNKDRLAATFINIRDQKSAMAKVDWDQASLAFNPNGGVTAASFKTSITRIKRNYSNVTASDRSRFAACLTHVKTPADLLLIMGNVNWNKAASDFKPSGKPISASSFRTSIQRLLKDNSSGSGATGTASRKRKAPAADRSPSASATNEGRKKITKANQAVEKDDRTRSMSAENEHTPEEGPAQPGASSKSSSPSPLVKTEDADNSTYGREQPEEEEEEEEEEEAEPQFFTD